MGKSVSAGKVAWLERLVGWWFRYKMHVYIAVFFAVLLAFTLLASGCTKSDGSGAGRSKPLGGTVYLSERSPVQVKVYTSWAGGNTPKGKARLLEPGTHTRGDLDIDGFCIPKGVSARYKIDPWGSYRTERGPFCRKVSDYQTAYIDRITANK